MKTFAAVASVVLFVFQKPRVHDTSLYLSRINPNFRKLMSIIREDEQDDDKSWARVKNYCYRNHEKLTEYQVKQVVNFLHDTLDPPLVPFVLQQCPRILRHNVKTFLRPTVLFLQELYGPELFQEAILRKPDLLVASGLGYDTDALEAVEFYFKQELGLSDRAIQKLKQNSPEIFQIPLTKIITVTHYLTTLVLNGTSEDEATIQVSKVIARNPNLLQLSVKDNLKARIEYLKERCLLDDKDVASLIQGSNAAVLSLSIHDNLKPTIDLLSLHLTPRKLRKTIVSHPQLLGLSIQNLRAKLEYLNSLDDESSDPTLTSRILERAPAVFSLSLENNIKPTIDFLAGIWDPSDDTTLASLISEYPTILTLSMEGNLRPTVSFFNKTGYIELDESWNRLPKSNRTILRGRCLAASLSNRLLPRWHYCQLQEKPRIPLHVLASSTDAGFCEAMNISAVEYKLYKTQAVPQLRFSSQFDTWLKTGRPIDV